MTEDYYNKVLILAKVKYNLSETVVESKKNLIEIYYNNNFGPRRATDTLARVIFDFK